MTDPSDDMLMALADAQIDGPGAEALRRRIAADPALAARYAVFAESRAALQAAFDPGETPPAMVAAIRDASVGGQRPPGGVVVPLRRRPALLVPLALAASVLVAVGGFLAQRGPGPGTPLAAPGALAAAALAGSATGEAADLDGGGSARVLGSYQTDRGLCRILDLDLPQDRRERAVVCREAPGKWTVVAAISAGPEEAFLPASDSATALIDQALDALGAGPALAPEEEAAALAP